jgi:hypothetical protein
MLLLIAWLQLILTVPIDSIIDYIFDHYILAPTTLAIEEQQKLLQDAMKDDTTDITTNTTNTTSNQITSILNFTSSIFTSNGNKTNKVTPTSTFTSIITPSNSSNHSRSSNQVTPIDIDTENAITTTLSSSTSNIKSTILVTKEFVNRRYKMIVDFLSDHHKDTTTTTIAMDISKLDNTEVMFKLYQGKTNTTT